MNPQGWGWELVLTQVQLLFGPSIWLLLVSAIPHTVTGYRTGWHTMGDVLWGCHQASAQQQWRWAGPSTSFSKAHFLRGFTLFQFLIVTCCSFDTCWYKRHFSECSRGLRTGKGSPSPCQLTLPEGRSFSSHHRASSLEEGAKGMT